MSLNEIAVSILVGLSSLLHVGSTPVNNSEDWSVISDWHNIGDYYSFEAKSKTIISYCRIHSNGTIQFPNIIHGAHQIFLDGLPIEQFGDPEFESVRSFYGVPTVRCTQVKNGKELVWKVYSYTRYFARFA